MCSSDLEAALQQLIALLERARTSARAADQQAGDRQPVESGVEAHALG